MDAADDAVLLGWTVAPVLLGARILLDLFRLHRLAALPRPDRLPDALPTSTPTPKAPS